MKTRNYFVFPFNGHIDFFRFNYLLDIYFNISYDMEMCSTKSKFYLNVYNLEKKKKFFKHGICNIAAANIYP